jgi:hypothetical protein
MEVYEQEDDETELLDACIPQCVWGLELSNTSNPFTTTDV